VKGNHTIPNSAVAQNHGKDKLWCSNAALVGAVVVTLTVNCVGVVALMFALPGTVQVAPAGTPVQVRVAVPLSCAPPIERVYFAVAPGATEAEPEPPAGIPNPRLVVPVPAKATV
jgi:hypothetical protein